jgi:hypothetical protein
MITIFKNIFSKEPYYLPVDEAIDRIFSGKSRQKVEEIRRQIDKEKSNKLKANLPSVCFSGKFGANRKDDEIIEHSGYIVLDFDNVFEIREKQTEIINHDFVYACWVSPSGNGLKALIKIADGGKHREHFQALQDIFPEIDKSGSNPSRVCYESYDPEIYINKNASVFNKIKSVEKIVVKEREQNADYDVFKKLLTWLSNRNDAFVTGERNNFIFKLAAACCRFGISEESAEMLISSEFLSNSEFSKTECSRAIKSAYRANRSNSGTAYFEREKLIDRATHSEVSVDETVFDEGIKPQDVIYGIDVKDRAMSLYDEGFSLVKGIGVSDIDDRFRPKKGELTLLTGIGNYGKSSFKRWYQVFRVVLYGEKFATFSPEDNPPEEYYHDLVEILLGCDCTPRNPHRPSRDIYERAYDFICNHFFYVYPKNTDPTPQYIKEVFLELIVKEQVDGCDIDPFNQMSNNYSGFPGRDKYLEWVLTDFSRFAIMNDVYFWVVAHPIKLQKLSDGNYPCPDVFDIADGSMWNNKCDNILVYHRPLAQTDPQNPMCEFYSKKIRRQKTVGKKGFSTFEMNFPSRRFIFLSGDPLYKELQKRDLDFKYKQTTIKIEEPKEQFVPISEEEDMPF